jgi:hypothetical protein
MTCLSSRTENPFDGSIHSGPRREVRGAQNTKALGCPEGPAKQPPHKIWFASSSSQKCTPISLLEAMVLRRFRHAECSSHTLFGRHRLKGRKEAPGPRREIRN